MQTSHRRINNKQYPISGKKHSTEEDITSSNYWVDTSQSPLYKRQISRSPKYKNY